MNAKIIRIEVFVKLTMIFRESITVINVSKIIFRFV